MPNKDFVIDDKQYLLGPDIEGNVHDVKELQESLLQIILEIDRICRKNNIGYALAFGSALGLVNYGTFTPWDDDADIVIDYFDIPRFVEACQKDLDKRFVLEGYEVDKRYNVLIPTFKMRLVNSYQKEKNWFWLPDRCHNGTGFFVDICAFMGVPEDEKEHHKLLKKAKNAVFSYVALDAILHIQPYHIKKKLKEFENKIATQYKDSSYVSQTVIIPWQDQPKIINKNAFPKEVIYPFKEYTFAGHQLYSFNNPEEFVRLRYGEKCLKYLKDGLWMDPMPEHARKVWHTQKYHLSKKIK